jgi:putative ABC transport system permease protein
MKEDNGDMRIKRKVSRMWLLVEAVLVFVIGWFAVDNELAKLLRRAIIPMGWDVGNVLVVPVRPLPEYDPEYRPQAAGGSAVAQDFQRIGTVLASLEGVESTAPCGLFFPGIDNSRFDRAIRDSTHFLECCMLYRVMGTDFMEVFGYEWVLPENGPSVADDALGSVVVSEDVADFLFPGENPIGRSFESLGGVLNTVVGVVPRQKLREPTGVPVPVIISNIPSVSAGDISSGLASWVVRVKDGTDTEALIPYLNRTLSVRAVFGNLRTDSVYALSNKLESNDDDLTFVVLVYVLLNLVLGALSYWLLYSRKSKDEFGVRLAMGATAAALRRRAVLDSFRISVIGAAIGMVIVFNLVLVTGRDFATKGAVYFGVYPAAETLAPWPVLTSPFLSALMVTLVVAAVVFAVNALAALLSVWKVSRMRPSETLREE